MSPGSGDLLLCCMFVSDFWNPFSNSSVSNSRRKKRFELIDKAAAERGTVARDLVMALAKNKSLRQFIRDVNAGRCNLEMTQQSKR